MVRASFFAFAAALASAAAVAEAAGAGRKPLITAEPFFGTAELVYDIYEHFYYGSVEPLWPQVDKALDTACEKTGLKKQELLQKLEQAKAAYAQGKATAFAHLAQIDDLLSEKTAKLVGTFNEKLPTYAGVIPERPVDLFVFALYSAIVLYVLFRIAKLLLGIFCFFCCCGCCRRKSAESSTGTSKSARARAKSANGQAAPKPAGKPTKK